MLRTRIFTALVLMVVLLSVLFSRSPVAFNLLCAVFFVAACWEGCNLFAFRFSAFVLVLSVLLIIFYLLNYIYPFWNVNLRWVTGSFISLLGCVVWFVLFIPSLKFGLPERKGIINLLYGASYFICICACFIAILYFEKVQSSFTLLLVMAIVWVADIGAYFFGKAFGRHKLAVTISPGKSWEGAIGGWFCVLVFGTICAQFSFLPENFFVHMRTQWGWIGLFLVLSFLTAISVTGDLAESQLKRRAQMKDSSNLLPGHGGVLDRIDALIPVLPMAMLIEITTTWYQH